MRIVLADDHPLVLSGLDALLKGTRHEVVAREQSGRAVLDRVAALAPDALVLDIVMPDMSGLDVLRSLRAEGSELPVVLLTATLDDRIVIEALQLHVNGFVLKDSAAELLLRCLDEVEKNGRWIDRDAMSRAVHAMTDRDAIAAQSLTPREREIAALVVKGLRNREIGIRLNLSEGTVKGHLHNIYEKLDVMNRAEFTAFIKDHDLS